MLLNKSMYLFVIIMTNIVNFPNKEAHNKWMSFSKDQQQRILENVWCAKCSSITEVSQIDFKIVEQDILIKGYCIKCNSDVARLVEI